MVISQSQFCINSLTQYFKPGGPINLKSQLLSDANRPLVNGNIVQGFSRNTAEQVIVELSGIQSVPGDNLFSEECFTFNCFQEAGLGGVQVEGVSTICMSDVGGDTQYRVRY